MHFLRIEKVNIVLIGLLFVVVFHDLAKAENPDWSNQMYFEDSKYKWYVCVGEDPASEAKAINNAIDECYKTAIIDNFVVQASVSQQTLETEYDSKVSLRKNILSDKIQLRDFERTNQRVVSEKRMFKAYIQYRYLKSAIAEEKQRMSDVVLLNPTGAIPPDVGFASGDFGFVASNGGLKYNTRISVETIPAGARVFIDDEQVGFSNLTISNYFRPLKYTLKVVLDGYSDVVEEIELKENQPQRIHWKLSKIKTKFKMNVYPQDTEIYVDNKKISKNWIVVEYDSKINLRFTRKNCADLEVKEMRMNQKTDIATDFNLYCEVPETESTRKFEVEPEQKLDSFFPERNFGSRLSESLESYFFGFGGGLNYIMTSSSTLSTYNLSGVGFGPECILMLNGVYLEGALYNYKQGKFSGYKSQDMYERTEKEISFISKRVKVGIMSRSQNGYLGVSLYSEQINLEKPETYFEESDILSSSRKKAELSSLNTVGMSFDIYSTGLDSNSQFKFSFQMGTIANKDSKKSMGVLGLGVGFLFGARK